MVSIAWHGKTSPRGKSGTGKHLDGNRVLRQTSQGLVIFRRNARLTHDPSCYLSVVNPAIMVLMRQVDTERRLQG
jgi:hypothetical protein